MRAKHGFACEASETRRRRLHLSGFPVWRVCSFVCEVLSRGDHTTSVLGQKDRSTAVSSVDPAARAADAPQSEDLGTQVKKNRRPQTCSICGQPRKGHTCPGAPVAHSGGAAAAAGTAAAGGTKSKGKEIAEGGGQQNKQKKDKMTALKNLLASRKEGLKEAQSAFTASWVKVMLSLDDPNRETVPSLQELREASDRHVQDYMEEHDDNWLREWKDMFQSVVMKPGDEALKDLQAELEKEQETVADDDGEV